MSEQLPSEQIAECPECDGVAISEIVFERQRPIGFRVICIDCDKWGPTCPNEDFAIASWNEASKS